MAELDRAICRLEVQGRISSVTHSDATGACLVVTMMNGAHIFSRDSGSCSNTIGGCVTHVESFPHHIIGEDPIVSSCFLCADSCLVVGSAMGNIAVVSRQSRTVARCYTFQDGAPVLSLKEVPHEPSLLLNSSPGGAQVIDVERDAVRLNLVIPKRRVVGAVAVSSNTLAVANYDGRVMLYDARCGCDPLTVLAVPDQVTSIAASPDLGAVAAGTVGGRVFLMRCAVGNVREEALGTGKTRAPIRCVSLRHGRIAAGDISSKLTLINVGDCPGPTTYWTAHSLLPRHAHVAAATAPTASTTMSSWCVSAAALEKDALWAAMSSTDSAASHVVVLPL